MTLGPQRKCKQICDHTAYVRSSLQGLCGNGPCSSQSFVLPCPNILCYLVQNWGLLHGANVHNSALKCFVCILAGPWCASVIFCLGLGWLVCCGGMLRRIHKGIWPIPTGTGWSTRACRTLACGVALASLERTLPNEPGGLVELPKNFGTWIG